MSRTLILMRHAKSGWDDPTLDDTDRPLNDRGRKAAPLIADWLAQNQYLPEKALVSSARRTLETWERMANRLPGTLSVESTAALYLAGPDVILNAIKNQTAASLLVICHNPGIAMFAEQIVASPPNHRGFSRYPTAATCVISFNGDAWSNINWRQGKVVDFTVPRDLAD